MRGLILALTLAVTAPAASAQQNGYVAAGPALAAADWDMAYLLAAGEGQVAADLITWARLRNGDGVLDEFAAFAALHPGWPGLSRLRRVGETVILADEDPVKIIAYFAGAAPQTGQGTARLASALIAAGQADAARSLLTTAWLEFGLDEDGEAAMLAEHAAILLPLHGARVDALLWRWRTAQAESLLDHLPEAEQALARARIALIRGDADGFALAAAVPAALRTHPGLVYDRYNRLATNGDYTDAIALLMAHTQSAEALGQPFRWASWRASLARWTMRDGRPRAAYQIAVQHHLTEGGFYNDLEWLAGFIALTDLADPALALHHFARFEAGASGPISLSRAAYWAGRAQGAAGDAAAARQAYGRAAAHQTAFYGLLASERLGLSLSPSLAGAGPAADWRGAGFRQTGPGQALELLLAAGNWQSSALFVLRLAQDLEPDELALLGAMLEDKGETYLSVVLGKEAVSRGVMLPRSYFPVHPLAQTDLPVSPELALAIARRESEFNFTVGSPVGALGLMQLMPATAREVAEGLGLPYTSAMLTDGWQYNAQLGSAYLAELTQTFGESPVMIAAGYNAGPSRPRSWMAQRGDPRAGAVDIVDWIEHIPFNETRNYVMRVAESLPIYRARLTGQTGLVHFSALLIGAPPFIRPQARPSPAERAAVEAERLADEQRVFAPLTALRPLARPEVEPG